MINRLFLIYYLYITSLHVLYVLLLNLQKTCNDKYFLIIICLILFFIVDLINTCKTFAVLLCKSLHKHFQECYSSGLAGPYYFYSLVLRGMFFLPLRAKNPSSTTAQVFHLYSGNLLFICCDNTKLLFPYINTSLFILQV